MSLYTFLDTDIADDPRPLGLENYEIPDARLSASSEWDPDHGAKRGRLNLARVGDLRGAWSAKNNNANQWFQVNVKLLTLCKLSDLTC